MSRTPGYATHWTGCLDAHQSYSPSRGVGWLADNSECQDRALLVTDLAPSRKNVTRPATTPLPLTSNLNLHSNFNIHRNYPPFFPAMSTKRSHSALADPSPAPPSKARAMTARRFIDPYLVLQGLEQQNITSDEAVVWIKNLMNKAIAMPAPPEKKKIKSQKVGPCICSSSLRLTDGMYTGPLEFHP